ncbi:hypothetical protein C8J57DRAFT_1310218 [Mycena rebaudengoi]|nr:hypothetical protein C8J57DRAFT_1310218 [Mycena rebaudengoi]
MAFRRLASKIRSHVHSPSQGPSLPAEPVVADRNLLTNVLTFSLAILGEAPLPGVKAAATALLDIIRRVESIKESKGTLQMLAAHMEYLLFLSSKVMGDVGVDAVEKLREAIAELEKNIPRGRKNVIAFFVADDTKARLQVLTNQLNKTISAFQIALQLNTDEKIERILGELTELKNNKYISQSPSLIQDLQNMELNTKRTLNLTVISVGQVDSKISQSKMCQLAVALVAMV